MRKILAMLLALVLVVGLMVPAAAAAPNTEDIVILYTNDVHTYIDGDMGYDAVAALKAEMKTQYENVLLVDAGDHAQGTAYGSMDKGQSIINLMNAAGYDAATLGNHEFDYGMEGCENLRSWANFPYLSCNFYHESAGVRGENVLDSYKIFEMGGEKVAIIGITTPESFTKSTPAYFQDENGNYIYGIAGGSDGAALYADVQKAIDAAKAEGATQVIALGHLGVDASSSPWTSTEVIASENLTSTTTIEQEEADVVNTTDITVNFIHVDLSLGLTVLEMDENHQILKTHTFAPGELPESLEPLGETAYILTEEQTASDTHRALYQKEDTYFTALYRMDDMICAEAQCDLEWQE